MPDRRRSVGGRPKLDPEEKLAVRVLVQLKKREARAVRRLTGRGGSLSAAIRSVLLRELERQGWTAGVESAPSSKSGTRKRRKS